MAELGKVWQFESYMAKNRAMNNMKFLSGCK